MRPVALVALVLALTSCGGGHLHGTATLWVTSDRGAHVLFTGTVPAGLSAMQALTRVQKVGTRYGGRYVQSIDGLSGSLSSQHDWFLFVNGVESGTGAADVRLRPGDIEWWDYRSWSGGAMSVPVVLGAFPEPFLHGFQWAKRGGLVVYGRTSDASVARAIAREIGGKAKSFVGMKADLVVIGNLISIGDSAPSGIRREDNDATLHLTSADAARLAANPAALRFQYGVAK